MYAKTRTVTLWCVLWCPTHRHCFIAGAHEHLEPANEHVRQVGDKEDDASTRGRQVGAREEHADQETHHDGGEHEHDQEHEDDDGVAVLQQLSPLEQRREHQHADHHEPAAVDEPGEPVHRRPHAHHLHMDRRQNAATRPVINGGKRVKKYSTVEPP